MEWGCTKFIYDFYTFSLFLSIELMPFIFSQYTFFRVAATRHRGAISSLLLGDSVYRSSLPVSCASVKRVCEVDCLPKVFINGDYY